MINHDRARRYNLSRDLDPATLARLSAAAGRDVRGWTDADIEAIAAWQRAQGLTPDGMVGPRTVDALPVAAEGAPLITKSPASGSGHYDHAYDASDPSRGGWPKVDAQWEAVTGTGSWLAGMLRLLTGRQVGRGGAVTYSRGPDDFITLDTYSIGIAHWWADTAPQKLLTPLVRRFPGEAVSAWGMVGAEILQRPPEVKRVTGTAKGHRRFDPATLRWLLDGWWAVARRPHWLAAQVELWAEDYIGEALRIASAQGVDWDALDGPDRGRVLAGIARMCNSSPRMARDVLRRFWGGRGDLVAALQKAYGVERSAGGYSKGGNGPGRWARIEAMCATDPGEAVLGYAWAEAVAQGIDCSVAPQRARGV